AVGRPAAAPLHRACDRDRAGSAAPGRAGVCARSHRDGRDRGAHARPQAGLHARDRHTQHAAGGARRGHDGVLLAPGRRRPAHRRPRGIRLDRQALHEPGRQAHGGLRHREVRLRTSFQDELNLLETTLHEEGALVLRALRGALNALEQRDHELADEVIAFDDDVDQRYVAIEEGIQSLLARQTPVAGDLRLVLAILHVNLHLERMADYCVTIAKLSKLVPDVEPSPRFIEGFEEMGSRCEEMIRIALDAFANRNLEGAESLVALDELIDRANRRVVERILELGEAEAMREYGLRMVLVSRSLERIG